MAKKKAAKNRVSADTALKRLKAGNERYLGHDALNYPTDNERTVFATSQQPYAIVLSCADSRVSPEILFNVSLNEIFVVRVAGNIADTTSIASIEYAVAHLNTNLIVVLGHEACGAVGAALAVADEAQDLGYNLNNLVAHITPAVAAAKKKKAFEKDPIAATVKENTKLNAKELRTRSPIISKARGVKIVAGYYSLVKGKVDFTNWIE
ncbi:Carbonic anhydrase [Planctomycetes bacterium MalM25]|nr:Carbonic anhydrase [Planctomycetes bacterium MalM25]